MSEDTVVEEVEDQEVEDQEVSVHPYDLPGEWFVLNAQSGHCLLYTSPSARDLSTSRMPSSA